MCVVSLVAQPCVKRVLVCVGVCVLGCVYVCVVSLVTQPCVTCVLVCVGVCGLSVCWGVYMCVWIV